MTAGRGAGLLERLTRHPAVRLAGALFVAWLAAMFYVRGEPLPPGDPARLPQQIAALAAGAPLVLSQQDLLALGAVAAGLTIEEGHRPGPFHVLFLPRLDRLEKFHHLMHGPFTGIRRMYCDVWIHSVTSYGRAEATWGFEPVIVRPALKLPLLLFLMDRLAREKTSFGEYTGAVFEAFAGMEMHTVPGRGRLWERMYDAGARYPVLADWVAAQLPLEDPAWTDNAEMQYWSQRGSQPPAAQWVEEVRRRRAARR